MTQSHIISLLHFFFHIYSPSSFERLKLFVSHHQHSCTRNVRHIHSISKLISSKNFAEQQASVELREWCVATDRRCHAITLMAGRQRCQSHDIISRRMVRTLHVSVRAIAITETMQTIFSVSVAAYIVQRRAKCVAL